MDRPFSWPISSLRDIEYSGHHTRHWGHTFVTRRQGCYHFQCSLWTPMCSQQTRHSTHLVSDLGHWLVALGPLPASCPLRVRGLTTAASFLPPGVGHPEW
ncbi:hypothetical protein PAXRUDRAFT_825984 [Paxillus rubicundulus Ve08.2h10]|uniref:Uncharacterized protein n=1 Tax=Paxillus rubicundulus Ve08.2h10 TaxID=930991 RepID=A0A0D0E543_9AGAM|nr:hypothetical protein PAXRUDRAFT_825984 [Paxillus rubicundulus Ve08.2h10]